MRYTFLHNLALETINHTYDLIFPFSVVLIVKSFEILTGFEKVESFFYFCGKKCKSVNFTSFIWRQMS